MLTVSRFLAVFWCYARACAGPTAGGLAEYSLTTSGVLDLRHGARGGNGSKMAALKEERCYGLSCGRVSNGGKVSVFHVKLTDSALRAFEGYRGGKVNGSCRYSHILVSLWSLSGRLWQAEFGQSPLTLLPPPPPLVLVLVLLVLVLVGSSPIPTSRPIHSRCFASFTPPAALSCSRRRMWALWCLLHAPTPSSLLSNSDCHRSSMSDK